jgi:hypothetical protein
MHWKRDAPENDEAWDNYQRALKAEFQLWYGHEDDLAAWHALCRAIGINKLPDTCQACEKVSMYIFLKMLQFIAKTT